MVVGGTRATSKALTSYILTSGSMPVRGRAVKTATHVQSGRLPHVNHLRRHLDEDKSLQNAFGRQV